MDIMRDDPDLRYPTPLEAMPRLKTAINALAERDGISYPIPALSTLKKYMLANKPPEAEGLDAPWTFGMSEYGNLPDNAAGALLKVWKYVKTQGYTDPFTVRQAKWVNKLRWVPEAGGSSIGEIENLHTIYTFAVAYAGRQLMAQAINQKKGKGMHSEYLDAQMMFSEAEYNARKSELLDDSAINTYTASKAVAPQHTDFITLVTAVLTGRAPELQPSLDLIEQSLLRFGTNQQEASNILTGIRLFNDEEGNSLSLSANFDAFFDLADSLFEAFIAGNMNHWDPPIQSIREKYLGESG
jgi:hypothetical protein